MTNHQIAAVFEQIADLLEFQGANQFRVRAYRNAARTIHDLPQSAAEIVNDPERSLAELPGIGKDLAEKVATLVTTGSLPMLDELRSEVPESVMAVLRVPGLGPKRAAQLFRELKVATLDALREACESHKVQEIKGLRGEDGNRHFAGPRHRLRIRAANPVDRGRPACATNPRAT